MSRKSPFGLVFRQKTSFIEADGFYWIAEEMKRKPAYACGRRRSKGPAGREAEETGDLLHSKPAGLEWSFSSPQHLT
ncbi:MAG: hypothetical protein EA344_11645 [Alkalicoccus sp.]|nr:MAG: hypothetical protein EA344_11645 [Alkalicoccus sp.]